MTQLTCDRLNLLEAKSFVDSCDAGLGRASVLKVVCCIAADDRRVDVVRWKVLKCKLFQLSSIEFLLVNK